MYKKEFPPFPFDEAGQMPLGRIDREPAGPRRPEELTQLALSGIDLAVKLAQDARSAGKRYRGEIILPPVEETPSGATFSDRDRIVALNSSFYEGLMDSSGIKRKNKGRHISRHIVEGPYWADSDVRIRYETTRYKNMISESSFAARALIKVKKA